MKFGVGVMLLECTLKWYSLAGWGRAPWWSGTPNSDGYAFVGRNLTGGTPRETDTRKRLILSLSEILPECA
jgi:hypothetical protein